MNRIDGLGPLTTSRTNQGAPMGAVEGSGGDGAQGADKVAGAQDRVNFSSRGRVVADAARLVMDAPEVRADRVAQLKAAIADGTYTSNAREIAARLLAAGIGD